jgi:hypothetical protein
MVFGNESSTETQYTIPYSGLIEQAEKKSPPGG